jgi:hypothetical protein
MISIAYVPRATANDRGSWSLSRVVDTAGIGRGVPRLMSPQHPQSNAPTWIRPLSEKSFALLAALFLSLFVFVFAAGEAGAEEQQVVLPMDQWCAMPPGTAPPGVVPADTAPCPPTGLPSAVDDSPLDTSSAGITAYGVPPARPFSPPIGSVSLPAPGPAPGTELIPWQQHVLPSPGAEDIGGPRPEEPIRPHNSPTDKTADKPTDKPGTPKKFTPEEALPNPGSGANPGHPAKEATDPFVAPDSATEPKLASPALHKDGLAGLQPSSAPDNNDNNKLPAANSVPTAAERTADRTSDPIPSQVQTSGTEPSTVREVVEVVEPLVEQALTQTHTTISETVASALGTLQSWTAGWLPASEAAQSSSEGTAPDPLVPLEPLLPPMPSPGDSPFFSLPGTGQVGSGGGLGLLLLGVLASGLILLRRDGPLSWIVYELPKPTSALLLPLERPG